MDNTNTTSPGATAVNPPGLTTAGDYVIKSLSIITSDGQTVDIRSSAVEINLFEDIFSPCMTGSILMGDALDLIANLKLHGNEYLILSIDKPTLGQPLSKVFRIYKISKRQFKTQSMQNYIIHFASDEAILSTQRYMSKSYRGMIVSDMVKDIIINQLGVSGNKLGGVFEKTTGLFSIIIPRMNPIEAAQWLATRAYSDTGTLFLFFENRDGFNFISYETLIQIPVYQTYSWSPKLNQTPQQNMNSLNFLEIVQDFDIIASGRAGAYASSLMTYDFVDRKFTGTTFDATQFDLLNDNLPVNNSTNRFKLPLINTPDFSLKFFSTTDSDPNVNPSHPENWLQQKAMKLAQLTSYKMVASIPGDILMKAGRIVDVQIPKSIPKNQTGNILNENRSGSYLVSAVHHIFINDMSTTVMELLSDSVSDSLNAPLINSPGLTAVKAG